MNTLWGVRNIAFKRVEGFDALTGEQDVRTGFQLGTLLGRSLSVLGTTDDDIVVSTDIYAGVGTARSFAAMQMLGEGRQSYDQNRWDDILTSGRAAWYFKPHPRHTTIMSGEWSAGWRLRSGRLRAAVGECWHRADWLTVRVLAVCALSRDDRWHRSPAPMFEA